MKKIWLALIALMFMASFAFAAPSITINYPASTSVWWGTQTIDFNVIDENGDAHYTPPVINLYYSTTSGGFANSIIADSNVDNGTGIVCSDYNFFETTNCTYSWVVPTNLTNGFYYVDANYIPRTSAAGYTDSSDRFEVAQKFSTASCGLVGLFPLLIIAVLIIVIIVSAMVFMIGGDLSSLTVAAVAALVVIIIMLLMPPFMTALCG